MSKTWLETFFWEIKNRFFYTLLTFTLCFFVSYQYSVSLLYLFVLSYDKNKKDLGNDELYSFQHLQHEDLIVMLSDLNDFSLRFIFTGVEEAFSSSILVSLVFSFLAVFPYILYAVLSAISPSLFLSDLKTLVLLFVTFYWFWLCFLLTLQNKIIPKLAHFLLDFNIEHSGFHVSAETKIYSYLLWVITFFFVANLIFFCLVFLIYLINNQKIKLKRKVSTVWVILISAFLSPPDFFSQLLLAFILIILLEITIYFIFVLNNLKNK